MPKYYRIQDVSKEVSRYIGEKSLAVSPSGWRDIYAQEHAKAFTVAKMKDLSLLEYVQKNVSSSIENGDTFKDLQKKMQPKMQNWLDSVRKPPKQKLEGPELDAYNAKKDRYRLRRIFETNTRQAYAQHQYNRGMDNEFNTHIIYRIGPSINHRADHVAFDGTVLPKDHPFWDTHYPPNGWNCKCYVRFITKEKLEKYRKDGVPDLQSANGQGRFTRNKPINEQAPQIKWRNFQRSDGKAVRVPTDIDPGFEWNPGKVNRGTWLKDQALRKARALELAPNERQKLERLIVSNAAQQVSYQNFVERHYSKNSSGKTTDIGIIQEVLKEDRLQRLGSLPDSDLILLQDKVLNAKDQRHKSFVSGDSSVSKKEFLQLPKMLERPALLVWDNKHSLYILVKHTKKRQLLFMPLEVNRIKSLKGNFWTLRSVYRVQSYNEVFREKWRDKYRFEIINPKKKK